MQQVLDWLEKFVSDGEDPPLPQHQKWILFSVTAIALIWIIITIIFDIADRLMF